jgi:hypothetical protein
VAGQAAFTPDTDVRIHARNEAARAHIATRTGFGKFTAKASLVLANAVDRGHALFANADAALLSGALFGGLRGALIGAIVAAILPMLSVVAVVGGMALLFAAHDGFGEYNHARAHDPRVRGAHWADWIANKGGALGGASVPIPTEKGEFQNARHNAHMDHAVDAALEREHAREHYAPPPSSPEATTVGHFQAQENLRRGLDANHMPTAGSREQRFTDTIDQQRSHTSLNAAPAAAR